MPTTWKLNAGALSESGHTQGNFHVQNRGIRFHWLEYYIDVLLKTGKRNMETIFESTRATWLRGDLLLLHANSSTCTGYTRIMREVTTSIGNKEIKVGAWSETRATMMRYAKSLCVISSQEKGEKKRTVMHLLTHSVLFLLLWLVWGDVIATVFCDIFNYLGQEWLTDDPRPFRVTCYLLRQFLLGLWTVNYIARPQNNSSPRPQQLHVVWGYVSSNSVPLGTFALWEGLEQSPLSIKRISRNHMVGSLWHVLLRADNAYRCR